MAQVDSDPVVIAERLFNCAECRQKQKEAEKKAKEYMKSKSAESDCAAFSLMLRVKVRTFYS